MKENLTAHMELHRPPFAKGTVIRTRSNMLSSGCRVFVRAIGGFRVEVFVEVPGRLGVVHFDVLMLLKKPYLWSALQR